MEGLDLVESSLKNLQVDYLDLLQCHRYDPETPLEETVQRPCVDLQDSSTGIKSRLLPTT